MEVGLCFTWEQLYDAGYHYVGTSAAYSYFFGHNQKLECVYAGSRYVIKSITPYNPKG
jgi:hypothetical protein